MIAELNKIGGKHGVGVTVLAENRLVGMKSRGVYETPGGTILYEAHKALEQICIERDTLHYKQQVRTAVRGAGLQRPMVSSAARGVADVHRSHERDGDRQREGAAIQGPGDADRGDVAATRCTTRNSRASAWKDYDVTDASGFIGLYGLPMKVAAQKSAGNLTYTPVIMPLPGVSRLICIASKEFPRYSEGDAIELNDGRLLLALSRKKGSSDFAQGTIIGFFSCDRGVSWDDEPHVIQAVFEDVIDVMSVSLCRSPRGVHLFFLGRGTDAKSDTRIYQRLSTDEGKTWGKPVRVNERTRYHVVNNARVIRTSTGRMIVPSAFLDGPWGTAHDRMGVYCLFSDDDGVRWNTTADLALDGHPLMEPGVAECADGSLYMTIRTTLGVLYEAHSRDQGATWTDFGPTKLPSPAALSTVFRDPTSNDLWMVWINRPAGGWKDRNPLSMAVSHDHGRTWETRGDIENDTKHSYGYVSVDVIDRQLLLTYYDWCDHGQHSFEETNLRQRTIPLDFAHHKIVPPVFQTHREPVLQKAGSIVSCNSGLLAEEKRWRLWYTVGTLGPEGETLRVHTRNRPIAG